MRARVRITLDPSKHTGFSATTKDREFTIDDQGTVISLFVDKLAHLNNQLNANNYAHLKIVSVHAEGQPGMDQEEVPASGDPEKRIQQLERQLSREREESRFLRSLLFVGVGRAV